MTGVWSFGGPGGIALPGTTITLDMLSVVSGDYLRGLVGHSADGSESFFPVEPNGGIGDGAGPIPLEGPIPVEPDGGIGDGAGPIVLDDPIPVESDGGIGDGAGPIALDDPMPVEPDGGIGDGAGPIPDGDAASDDGGVTIMPVEPDDGIGDGAGPPPDSQGDAGRDDGDGTIMPVEPDGGIGDGAGPPPDVDVDPVEENTIEGGGEGTKADDTFIASEEADTFIFQARHGNDTIHGFDVTEDRLDFSGTEIDFTDLESLLAHTVDQVDEGVVFGVYIETGEGTSVYLDGVSSADLASAMIDF